MKMGLTKKVLIRTIKVFVFVFFTVNAIYAATHYAFGDIRIPDWYDIVSNPGHMPIRKFIDYWINRGIVISLIWGFVAAIITLIIATLLNKKQNLINGK